METAVTEPPPAAAKPGLPWYITTCIAFVLCLVFGTIASAGEMWSWKVFWRWFFPSLLLVPVSVTIAAIPWSLRRRRKHAARFTPYFLGTGVVLTLGYFALFVGVNAYNARHSAPPAAPGFASGQAVPAIKGHFVPDEVVQTVAPDTTVPAAELAKIQIFDVEPDWRYVLHGRGVMGGVLGRIRNDSKHMLSSVTLEGVMRDKDGQLLETVNVRAEVPVKSGQAHSFKVELPEPLERVGQDSPWSWRVTSAQYNVYDLIEAK